MLAQTGVVKVLAPRNMRRTASDLDGLDPDPEGRKEGERLPATYINFYLAGCSHAGGGVLLPQFGDDPERDSLAVQTMQKVSSHLGMFDRFWLRRHCGFIHSYVACCLLSCQEFPGRKVIPVPSKEILLGGGNIHCITCQVPRAN